MYVRRFRLLFLFMVIDNLNNTHNSNGIVGIALHVLLSELNDDDDDDDDLLLLMSSGVTTAYC